MYNQPNNFYQSQYLPQFNQNYNQGNQLIRVTGIESAKAYQMPANSTVALFDSNEDYFYVKSTDGAGFPTIRTFSFTEVFDSPIKAIENNNFVNKGEFETFKQEVIEYVQQFIQQQTAKSGKQDSQTTKDSEQFRQSRCNISTDVSEQPSI